MKHPQSVLDYLARVEAEVLNFRRAIIKQHRGAYYIEKAIIRINSDGSVKCSVREYAPTEEESKAMQEALSKMEFPRTIRARSTDGLEKLVSGQLFEFIDRKSGEIIMVQERREQKNGTKDHIPWVMLSTGEWVAMEPDEGLPFWKPPQAVRGSKYMIHEGAKAAKAVTDMLARDEAHPWAEELSMYEHWGMIGGALAPHRTNYAELKREAPTEVVYVCDNDQPGESALQKISEFWGKSLKGIKFGKKFPYSFDMADAMPEDLFTSSGRYIGPPLKALMEPATFATELIPVAHSKRTVAKLKADFAEEWFHSITPEVFLHKDWPNQMYVASEFNSKVAPFSHVDDTARIMRKDFSSKAAVLKYKPGELSGIHAGSDSGMYINTYIASPVKAEPGDVSRWEDFMEYLIPDEADRLELKRWCATLIARPDIRMIYGVLLISEMQGVGKGTLGEKILAPLVGESNVSYPSETTVVDSNFNYWLAQKRLAVMHEIYAGHSSKAYNKLKECITDKFITVSKKYQADYVTENWVHIYACSNSLRAIKLVKNDRRWFIPQVTEEKRPAEYWERFNRWLTEDGGLNKIAFWAKDFLADHRPVDRSDGAPWSGAKKAIIEEGYSPGQSLVAHALEDLAQQIADGDLPENTFVLDTDLVKLIKNELYEGRQNDRLERPATVRSVAKEAGWYVGRARAQIREWGQDSLGARIISRDKAIAEAAPGDLGGRKIEPEARLRPYPIANRSSGVM